MEQRFYVALLLWGMIFHCFYIYSMFDIYFKSPIIHGMHSVATVTEPPASRVVIYIADGCRADVFFEANGTYFKDGQRLFDVAENETVHETTSSSSRVPFLRNMAEIRGSYGVSHTQVPTESRPGHVAMFAGFYEDVSAVANGWQSNPADYDSVFNQSSHAWLFGSPDIVPMFATPFSHVEEEHYSAQEEDFATDAYTLDVWVVDKVQALLERASFNATLNAQLRAPRTVFFMHFLGIDVNGHAHRPNSAEYLRNLAVMDRATQKCTQLIDAFFHYDEKTAYIMTADHGMSAKGAHGDGSPANTRTPLVAWGAGIRGPEPISITGKEQKNGVDLDLDVVENALNPSWRHVQEQYDAVSETFAASKWKLSGLKRKDIMQADIAPLMAALIGIATPLNSVGVLPLPYLSAGKYRAEAVSANAKQLVAQAVHKSKMKESQSILYTFVDAPTLKEISTRVVAMEEAFVRDDYPTAEKLSMGLMTDSLAALDYFQTYDWLFLMSTISLGYLSWIGVLYSIVTSSATSVRPPFQTSLFVLLWVLMMLKLALQSSPLRYYVYTTYPILYCTALFSWRSSITGTGLSLKSIGGALCVLELIIFGYSSRQIFAPCFLLVACLPYLLHLREQQYRWTISCILLAIFPLLPSEYGDATLLVHVGTLLLMGSVYLKWKRFKIQLSFLICASLLVQGTMLYLDAKEKPPAFLRVSCWLLAIGATLPAFFPSLVFTSTTENNIEDHLFRIFLAMAPSFILLSISYEVLFYGVLCHVLIGWLYLETNAVLSSKKPDRGDNKISFASELRLALVFLLLTKIAFFGTGNIASMSSFELRSTYRFITVFSPFIMGALLIVKIIIPFTLVTCVFQVITKVQGVDSHRVFLWVCMGSAFLCTHAFFLVQNVGSWKEIGNSIAMFGIVNLQIVFIPLLFFMTGRWTTTVKKKEE